MPRTTDMENYRIYKGSKVFSCFFLLVLLDDTIITEALFVRVARALLLVVNAFIEHVLRFAFSVNRAHFYDKLNDGHRTFSFSTDDFALCDDAHNFMILRLTYYTIIYYYFKCII